MYKMTLDYHRYDETSMMDEMRKLITYSELTKPAISVKSRRQEWTLKRLKILFRLCDYILSFYTQNYKGYLKNYPFHRDGYHPSF